MNPSGGTQLASCFPGKWSCDPSTCITSNFSLPHGDVVAQGDSSSTTRPSPSARTDTVVVTSYACGAAQDAKRHAAQCTSRSKQNADMAIVGVCVGMPLLIIALVVAMMLWKEKGLSRKVGKERDDMERRYRSAVSALSRKGKERYQLSSGTTMTDIVEYHEVSASSPPSRRG